MTGNRPRNTGRPTLGFKNAKAYDAMLHRYLDDQAAQSLYCGYEILSYSSCIASPSINKIGCFFYASWLPLLPGLHHESQPQRRLLQVPAGDSVTDYPRCGLQQSLG